MGKISSYVVHLIQGPLIFLFDIISEESARSFVGEIAHITKRTKKIFFTKFNELALRTCWSFGTVWLNNRCYKIHRIFKIKKPRQITMDIVLESFIETQPMVG